MDEEDVRMKEVIIRLLGLVPDEALPFDPSGYKVSVRSLEDCFLDVMDVRIVDVEVTGGAA